MVNKKKLEALTLLTTQALKKSLEDERSTVEWLIADPSARIKIEIKIEKGEINNNN